MQLLHIANPNSQVSFIPSEHKANVGQNIKPFAAFLQRLLTQSMKGKPIARAWLLI